MKVFRKVCLPVVVILCLLMLGSMVYACEDVTYTIGYWKNHPEIIDTMISAENPIWLGWQNRPATVAVNSADMAASIMNMTYFTAPDGTVVSNSNGIIKLYAQLMATRINKRNGANGTLIWPTVEAANQFLSYNSWTAWDSLPSEAISGYDKQDIIGWAEQLDNFNNGLMGSPAAEE